MPVSYKNNETILLENNIPLNFMIKGKSTHPYITPPVMMEKFEVVYECPDDTSPVVMEDCLNDEHEDSIRNDPIEENDAEVHDELREIPIKTEN